jgi:hypothetical protein
MVNRLVIQQTLLSQILRKITRAHREAVVLSQLWQMARLL